jgi:hypothetical protein
MLSAIFSQIGGALVDSILGKITGVFEAYFKKEISLAELRAKVQEAMFQSFNEIEIAHADALAKTYASFMGAIVQSKILQQVWAFVTLSQAFMLLWFQIGIPFIVAIGVVDRWPSSGDTAAWAYALVGACVGMGPLVLRAGAGSSSISDRLKGLIGK